MERRLEIILQARDEASQIVKGLGGAIGALAVAGNRLQAGLAQAGSIVGAAFARAKGIVTGLMGAIARVTGQLGALFSIASAFAGLRFAILAAADVERQRAQLAALTGSFQEAGRIIEWVTEQSRRTPFEIPGLIEMVAQLRSVGLDFEKWFEAIGDLAVQGGRDLAEGLEMATLAIVRLRTGATGEAMEQLRRLKISRRDLELAGVRFTAGGEIASQTEQVLEALHRVIQTKFGGSMRRMQETAAVAFSNVRDMLRSLALELVGVTRAGEVVEGGLFQRIRDATRGLLAWVERNWGRVAKVARGIGAQLAAAFERFVKSLPMALAGMQKFLGALLTLKDTVAATIMELVGKHDLGEALAAILSAAGQGVLRLARWWRENSQAVLDFLRNLARFWIISQVVAAIAPLVTILIELYKGLRAATIAAMAFMASSGPAGWKKALAAIGAVVAAILAGIGAFMLLGRQVANFEEALKGSAAAADDLKKIASELDLVTLRGESRARPLEDVGKRAAEAAAAAAERASRQVDAASEKIEELNEQLRLAAAHLEAIEAFGELFPDTPAVLVDRQRALEAHLRILARMKVELDDLYRLQVRLGEKGAQETLVKALEAQAAFYRGFVEWKRLFAEAVRIRLQPFERAAEMAESEVELARAAGADPTEALRLQVEWLQRLQAELEKAGRNVRRIDEVWWDLAQRWMRVRRALSEATRALATAGAERLVNISESEREVLRATIEMLRAQEAPLAAVNSARAQLLQLDFEHLQNLEAMLAAYEQAGQVIEANRVRAAIAGVRAEMARLQQEMRKGMEDVWDRMAAKIINAPASMQRVLAQAGVAIWQRQAEALRAFESLPRSAIVLPGAQRPIDVRVLVELDGEPLRALVRAEQDSQLIMFGRVGD